MLQTLVLSTMVPEPFLIGLLSIAKLELHFCTTTFFVTMATPDSYLATIFPPFLSKARTLFGVTLPAEVWLLLALLAAYYILGTMA